MIRFKLLEEKPLKMSVNPAVAVDLGRYYIPIVDEEGNLSWTPSLADMDPVETQNIKGPKPIKGIDYWTPEEQSEVETATAAANAASGEASAAAAKATQAANEATEAASEAVNAAAGAQKAAEAASKAAENAEAAAENANQAAGAAASAAGDARSAANDANLAAGNANTSASSASAAASEASSVAEEIRQARENGEFDGKDFTFEDFTPEQLADLKGEQGDPGVYVGSETPPEDATVWVDPNGEPTSTEKWVFTLEDGTTVTKTVVAY